MELLPLLLPAVQQAPPARRASTSTLAASPGHVDGLSSAGMLTEAEFSVVKSAVLAQGLRRCRASEMSCAPQVKSESAELLLAGLSRCQPSHEQSVTAAAPAPPAAVAAEQTDGPVRTAATAQSVEEPTMAESAAIPQARQPGRRSQRNRKAPDAWWDATKHRSQRPSPAPPISCAIPVAAAAATVVAEQVDEPVIILAAAVPVQERTSAAAAEERRVMAHTKAKKNKNKRKTAGGESRGGDGTDPDWVPGIVGRRKAHTPCSGGTASQIMISRFHGVSWNKVQGKWCVRLTHDSHLHNLGYFTQDKEEDAACAYDNGARRIRGAKAHGGRSGNKRWHLNFPTEAEVTAAVEIAAECGARFYGVSWNAARGKWLVQLQHDGQQHYLGLFAEDKEEDAARAYDTAARNLRGANAHGGRSKNGSLWRLNYPTPTEIASTAWQQQAQQHEQHLVAQRHKHQQARAAPQALKVGRREYSADDVSQEKRTALALHNPQMARHEFIRFYGATDQDQYVLISHDVLQEQWQLFRIDTGRTRSLPVPRSVARVATL